MYIENYIILKEWEHDNLEINIMNKIKDGYTLYGYPFYCDEGFCQAMIKCKNPWNRTFGGVVPSYD